MKAEFYDKIKIGASGWMDGVDDNLSSPSATRFIHSLGIKNALDALTITGTNPSEVYNIKSYGGVNNGVIPLTGNVGTGTNNSPALQAAINAAPANATVLVPAGTYLMTTPITITSKPLNLLILGNIITNGNNFLIFNAPGGADRQHTVVMYGTLYGAVNLVSHTKSRYTAGTGPDFASLTGAGITIGNNVNSMHVFINKIEGFQAGVDIVVGGGNGSQENTIACQKYNNNRYAIRMRSTDGVSWCDKNHFVGIDGGHTRVTGQTAIKIDGFNGAASTNGEFFNGAFRSDRIKILCESVTNICEVNGDVTEPRFDVTVEAGLNTGVFNQADAIQCRSISPNYVRGPKWCGDGILNTLWMTAGMGINGRIDMEMWAPNLSGDAANYLGNRAKIDSAGVINISCAPSLSKTQRDAYLSAPYNNNIRFVNEFTAGPPRTITTSTGSNTAADAGGVIYLNSNPMNFSVVNVTTNVNVYFDIININAVTATITGVTGLTSLAQNKGARIFIDGVNVKAIINP